MEESSKVVLSIGNYEGGLMGLSFADPNSLSQGNLKTEFAFIATQVSQYLPSNFIKLHMDS